MRIFSAVDYRNVLARNSRIITEKRSARAARSRHVRQCNTPSIERQYEAAYLSLFLLLSRAHFYERIHQPDYRWSLYCAYGIFPSLSLPRSLYSPYGLLISHSSYSFFPSWQARFFPSETRKIERCSIRVKVKEPLHGTKYFHTQCGFSYSWQTHRLRVLPDDVEIVLPDVATKQYVLV